MRLQADTEMAKPRRSNGKRPPGGPQTAARELPTAVLLASSARQTISSTTRFAELQLQELLSEIREDSAHHAAATSAVQHLAKVLLHLGPRQVSDTRIEGFASASGYKACSKPMPFAAPTAVYMVGSHATSTAIRQESIVDVAIEMPACSFERKDHLNHRYFAKRALYLAALAAELAKQATFTNQRWQPFNDDSRRPCLLITVPSEGEGPTVLLRLLPVCNPSMLLVRQLGPDSNAVRSVILPSLSSIPKQRHASGPTATPGTSPTPYYNTSVLQDVLMTRHTQSVKAATTALPRLADALLLLRCWARQCGFSQQPGSINGFHLTLLAVHLQQKGALSVAMSVLQLVGAILAALADSRTFAKGCFMARTPSSAGVSASGKLQSESKQPADSDRDGDNDNGGSGNNSSGSNDDDDADAEDEGCQQDLLPEPPAASAFRKHFEVVFVDSSGWLNVTAGVRHSALQQARQTAKLTVPLLAGGDGGFEAAFLTRHQPAAVFDYLYRITLTTTLDAELATSDAPAWRLAEGEVERVARRALGTRAILVRVLPRGAAPVTPAKGAATAATDEVLLGIRVDAAEAVRLVDMGPAAEDTAAAADFRSFWGAKSDLRRFPDGRISEAVVWDDVPIGERHVLPDELLTYALRRHLPVGTHVQGFAACLDGALTTEDFDLSDRVAAFRQLDAAAAALTKQLRALSTLVLKVVSVQPLAAALRHTQPFPPRPHPLAATAGPGLSMSGSVPRCLEPVQMLVQLENSGKWPSDRAAFMKAKAALGCQLAQTLSSSAGVSASASEACVDVLADGFAFRLLLWSSRDEAMAAQGAEPALEGETREDGEQVAESVPLRAAHHGLVGALAAVAPSYAAVAALTARWLAGHMFSGLLAHQEAGELLAAAVWSNPSTLPPPASRTAGFQRVLALVAHHPWLLRPLVVDPDKALSPAQRRTVVQVHDAAVARGLSPAIWLSTPYSATSSGMPLWVKPTLDRTALQRLTACATASLKLLQETAEVSSPEGDPEEVSMSIFRAPLAHFDALLTLRPEALPQANLSLLPHPQAAASSQVVSISGRDGPCAPPHRCARAVLSSIPSDVVSSRSPAKLKRELLVGFDPVSIFVSLLERRFGHLATFFWDGYGGRVIAIKWHRSALQPALFNPTEAHCVKPAPRPRDSDAVRAAAQAAMAAGAALDNAKARRTANGPSPAAKRPRQIATATETVVPDLLAVLAQMAELGQGLVLDVLAGGVTRDLEPSLG